jgi:excisionase family DNA binding protein
VTEQTVGLIEPFVTTSEAAGELRVSPATVIRRIGEGAFPGSYQDGRLWRIPRSAWIAYLKRTGALPSDEAKAALQVTP